MKSHAALNRRASQAASDAVLGAWKHSLRVNEHLDKDGLEMGAWMLFLVPWGFVGLGLFLPGPWWMRGLCIFFGVTFLCAGLLTFRKSLLKWRSGNALIHLFEDGAVLERTKGPIFALPYGSTPVDYVTWTERIADTGDDRARTHFWITLPEGRTVMLDAWSQQEREDLALIARHWRLPAEPRPLDQEPIPAPPVW
ncbi:MAG: hypothetical protein QHC78_07780 [Pigmentiphaga sp.]|uniref:hypothetical protein n=1 Tax=Pigmentiphaga sp. TaxID=1977564 RepID=UPI0029B3D3F1|nr:hypothetical protein [Pigmentiphaga sp.]MDX3905573.1 hypothetical protein [Pigmentiphaga sp.]